MRKVMIFAAFSFVALTAAVSAKMPIDYHAEGMWRSISAEQLSNDGKLLVYSLTATHDDGALVVRNLDTNQDTREPRGIRPQISDDSRYVGYSISPTMAELNKLPAPPTPPRSGFGLLDTQSGNAMTMAGVADFAFPKHASNVVAALGYPADPKSDDKGADLTIMTLPTGTKSVIGNAVAYALSPDGQWIAYAVTPPAKQKSAMGAGVFVRHIADGKTTALLSGKGRFAKLQFDENRDRLIFLADRRDTKDAPAYTLYWWDGSGDPVALVQPGASGLPAGWAPSDAAQYEFTKDGQRLFFGTGPVAVTAAKTFDPIKVMLWDWRDRKLPTQQREEAKQQATYTAEVVLPGRHFVQLASPQMSRVDYNQNPRWALGVSDWNYQAASSWDTHAYVDLALVDLSTGAQKPIAQHVLNASLSPGGKYVVYWDDHASQWNVISTADGSKALLKPNPVVLLDNSDNANGDIPAPYGIAGWTPDDASLLVNDRYDIWQADPQSGAMHLVTNGVGRQQQLHFQYVSMEKPFVYGRVPVIAADKPIVLSAVDENTKDSGFYSVTLGSDAAPKQLLMLPKSVRFRDAAKNADRLIISEERFEEFPDLWTTNLAFDSPQKVTDANPQQAQYNWGTSKLIDYTDERGQKLRAILTTPDNFDPSKKYPMMVYVYERMTDGLNNYMAPESGTTINLTRFVSNGYVVLQPDIEYTFGHTTASAVDCVSSAVKTVLAMGFVDPARLGMAGHSYGGYETNALVTHTHLFAAAESGAGDSDLTSLYGGFWGTGNVQQGYYENSQGRLGVTPWDDPQIYIENSPLYFVQNVTTPYLRIQDDEDGAVPYGQGVEFFTALRRAGKQAWMFTFIGEGHGLSGRKDMDYWTVHMDQFLDHYLLGMPEPAWMTSPADYAVNGEASVEALFSPQH